MTHERIQRELARLLEGGQSAHFFESPRGLVLYRDVPTAGGRRGLPPVTDVIVPVPSGYPGGMIDLAGLPGDSPFLPLVRGGQNNQGVVTGVDGRDWQLA